MAKFKVLRPIEHDQKLYLPEGAEAPVGPVLSSGHGKEIPVDTSGVIDLSESQAAPLLEAKAIEPAKKKSRE